MSVSAVPIVNIDDDVSNLLKNTPAKSDGVDVTELNPPSEAPQNTTPANPAPSQTPRTPAEERIERNRIRARERSRRLSQERKNNAALGRIKGKQPAPPPRGLSPDPEPIATAESAQKPQEPPRQPIDTKLAARIANTAYENVLIAVLGEDGRLYDAEKETLDAALCEYLKGKNIDLPPAWALVFCYGTVAMGKFNKPKSRERVATLWGYLRGKMSRRPKPKKPEDK